MIQIKCPLWGILLIYREESHDTIFAFKIHHVLADGYSLMHILDLLTNTRYKYQVKNFNDSKWDKFKIITEASFNIFKHNIKLSFVPASPLYQRDDNEIFLTYLSIPLSTIKSIRHKYQVRFQSVMLYLTLNYINATIVNANDKEEKIVDEIIITNSLPWPKHSRNQLSNHSTGATFVFRLKDQESGKKESLTDINNIFEDFYANHLDRAVYHLSKPFSALPLSVLDFKFAHDFLQGKLSGFYVHLIGSEEYKKVFDIECRDVHMYCTPPKQKGITINCITTSDEVRISIMGPKSLFATQENADIMLQENIQGNIADLMEKTNP